MKFKARAFSVIIAVCLFAGCFSGCSSVDFTGYFSPAYQKTNELSQLDMTVSTTITVVNGGSTRTIPMTFDVKELMSGGKATEATLAMHMNSKILGTTLNYRSDSYITGGQIYTNVDDVLTKSAETDTSGVNMSNFTFEKIIPQFSEEIIASSKAKKKKGNVVATFSFNGEMMRDTVSALLTAMYVSMGETEDYDITKDASLTDATATLTVNGDGYLSGYTVKIKTAAANSSNSKKTTTIDLSANINNPGKDVAMTRPENLNYYIDADKIGDASKAFGSLTDPETGAKAADFEARVAALRKSYGDEYTDYYLKKHGLD